jgi:hypothetical protein
MGVGRYRIPQVSKQIDATDVYIRYVAALQLTYSEGMEG